MVLHDIGIDFIVIKDPAVFGDPGDAEIRRSEPVKILSAAARDGMRHQFGLVAELIKVLVGKMCVHKNCDQYESQRQYGQQSKKD
jgi:hypothetical protein